MRPQTLGIIVASTITALFLAAVGIVAIGQLLPEPAPRFQQQGPGFAQFDVRGGIAFNELDFPIEQPGVEQPLAIEELPRNRGVAVPAEKAAISGPHAHGNLAIFLIHGEDKLNGRKIMTLQEGLEQGFAVVHDRGQLFIDNRSNAHLFIQAGDIVKGGSQDRTLPFDMLVAANTTNNLVAAMCVEQGRSGPRGNEMSASFHASTEQLPGRKLRMAAYRNSQAEVWNNVQAMQASLARTSGGSVQAPLSQTSLQLTLEHERLQAAVQSYMTKLEGAIADQNDVVGYAVVVNGNIQSADLYASNSLFQKLWPKLLKASAVEAIAERQPGVAATAPTTEAVQTFLADAEQGRASRVQNANRGMVIRQETDRHLLHETYDPVQQNVVLHRSYLAK